MYFKTTPGLFIKAFPRFIWKIPSENAIHLTFDDGPHPDTTPYILDKLKTAGAKGSFFLLGKQAEKYPEILDQIIQDGHQIAWHGFNHLNGWKTPIKDYISNVEKCQHIHSSYYFRPPYGKITPSQATTLGQNYKIVMWSHMPGDFDARQTESSIKSLMNQVPADGSIVVLHDNQKAIQKCLVALDTILQREIVFNTLA